MRMQKTMVSCDLQNVAVVGNYGNLTVLLCTVMCNARNCWFLYEYRLRLELICLGAICTPHACLGHLTPRKND
jgi:hypothetical protein